RGTTERFMHARVAHHQRPAVSTTIRIARAHVADAKVGLSLGQHRGLQDRRAYDQLDAGDLVVLGLPAGQNALSIMRLNPAFEEAGRHRQAYRTLLDRFQVHAREPARVDVVTDLGAQAFFDPRPALLLPVRH